MSDYLNPDQELRLECLKLAVADIAGIEPQTTVDRARAYYEFVTATPDRINAAIDWQPIATAPRDGRKIMLAIAGKPESTETGVWEPVAGRWEIARTAHGPLFLAVEPTHWADLVEGPAA